MCFVSILVNRMIMDHDLIRSLLFEFAHKVRPFSANTTETIKIANNHLCQLVIMCLIGAGSVKISRWLGVVWLTTVQKHNQFKKPIV